ncbi:unnamed protein product [Trifolium pratense]|uniref:Uncharacterized protein n=1 Tax=Trifolium pratense TaxID=57577 RepID=A0ACB0KES9_TRIPR|nr:unnamed protein product [Trifolium pratense]
MNSSNGGMMGFSKSSAAAAATAAAAAGSASSSPFTVSQWQELEHQALIFKYMVAGLPVPPDLVLPIQTTAFHSNNFFHHPIPTLSYCSFYGKKVDPEPGRCRRTDGKKWRCAKEAYPDSKYCERHMHRGRNRSRKPVESQTMAQSSSTVTTVTGGGSIPGNFQNLPTTNSFGSLQNTTASGTDRADYHLDTIPYGIPSKEYRYLQGLKSEGGEHSFYAEGSGGGNKGLQMESRLENAWPLMSTRVSSYSASKSSNDSMLQSDYPRHSFLSSEYGSGQAVKEEGQPLRPFFNEWPKRRESWSGLEDERSNQTAFSTTQLSISIPMSSSDFSGTSSQSPHDN